MSPAYLAFRLGAAIVPRLPRTIVRAATFLGGTLAWAVGLEARRAVHSNLQVVLDRPPSDREVRAVFQTQSANYADLFWLPRQTAEGVQALVDVEGIEHLTQALAGGRGAIVGALHLGNIEVVSYAARSAGFSVMLPVERLNPPELLELMIRLRQRAGLTCEPVGQGAFDRIREALRQNSIVGIGVDRITHGDGAVVHFCGRAARLPTAAAMLALRTGAPLLPVGCVRRPGGRFRVRIGPPIAVERSGSLRADVINLTERLLARLAGYLVENPTQWVMFHSIWDSSVADRGIR